MRKLFFPNLQSSFDKFVKAIGKENFSHDPIVNICYSYDATNDFKIPLGVIRPKKLEDVKYILECANEFNIPIIPRGAGTGFSGGAIAEVPAVILDLLAFKKIIDFDEISMTIKVEPGVVTASLKEFVAEHNLFYPPDPASFKISTIAGNVAENAGGPHCVKYGVTGDYVLVIEGYTGEGKFIRVGKPVLKNRSGYNLKDLVVGSEGTLMVFTNITLKLIPKPESAILFLAYFRKLQNTLDFIIELFKNYIMPASLEFMDQNSIIAIEKFSGIGLPTNFEALLYIELDGRKDELIYSKSLTEKILKKYSDEVNIADNKEDIEKLWEIRRKASPAMRIYGDKKINEDIVVPKRYIPNVIVEINNLSKKFNIPIISFGHIGDGNIHVNIMTNSSDISQNEKLPRLLNELFDIVNKYDGSVSGEHGIGISKKPFLINNLDANSYNIMRNIKKIFDPNNILNPAKIFV